MSEAQYKYKDSVERAGAVYLIAKDFDTFIVDFKRELQNKLNKWHTIYPITRLYVW